MNKSSILVVEDEALIAADLVQILSTLGYTVQKPVATGEDAIRSVKTRKPDLVLMDIKLIGDMDGIETAEKIRAFADIPLVYLTAFTDDTRLTKAQLTEPYGYILKPAHKHVLHGTIEMALYKHALDRKLKESEERYRSILDSMQDAYVRADAKGDIIMASPSAAHLFRYDSVNDIIGLPAATLYRYPEKRQEIIRIVKEQGEVHDFICEGMRKDGTSFWGSMNVQFTFDSKGEVTGTDGFIRDITERNQVDETLRQSEHFVSSILESTPNLIYIYDLEEHRNVYTNREITDFLGYFSEQILAFGSALFENILHPDDAQTVARHHARLKTAQDGEVMECEYRMKHANGSWRYLRSRDIAFLRNQTGEVRQILGSTEDITERKRAEVALRESEQRLIASQRIAKLGDITWEVETGEVTWSDALYELMQYDKSEKIDLNRVNAEIHHPDDLERVTKWLNDCIASGSDEITPNEYRIIRKDGKVLFVRTIGVIQRDGGKHVKVFLALQDISERKMADDLLRKSEEQYHSLLENVPELILVHRNGTILYTNPAAEKTLGYQPHEVANKQVTDFIAPEFHGRVAAAICRRMSGEQVAPYEIDVMGKDGSRRTMILNGTQVEFEGVPTSLIVLTDVTEQKALKDAATLANKKLNLLSSITRHDIINQVLALSGYLELSRDLLDDPVKLEEYITKEQNITRIIEAQMRFTKDYQDMGIKAPEWQNVHESVIKAKESFPLRGIAVETDSPTLELYADPLLERVFYNLIDNALRYGGEQMTAIRISSQDSDHGLVIVCEDDGVGVPADKKEAIFNRGYFKHTGFGLYLSREILGITGITIAETSEPGKGARFEITVPKGAYRFTGAERKN
jgi:PAS domain S-box-containing protein